MTKIGVRVTREVRDSFTLMCDKERGVRVTREVRDRFILMCDKERRACDKRGS